MLSLCLRVLMLICAGFITYMVIDLGYSYVTEGYGLHPAVCAAIYALTAALCAVFKRCMPAH